MSADASIARLSKYRLVRLLGSGGMGSVYLAHDPALNRHVAIKFVSPDRLGDAAARRRLIREAQAAAALDHPAICAVHEVVTDTGDGSACIVMAYVEGETLAERLTRGPMDVREVLSMATHLADALAAAHRRGIIHRDIKTHNIMLTPSGRPKLLDFGIATVRHPEPESGDKPQWTETHTDPVMGLPPGTPGYMSPEQIQQRPIDARSDLFSLGVVLFEALTGTRAFQGANPLEVHSAVLYHHPPPVSTLRPGLTDQHDELCRRLLAKDPADRFQSAEELLGALRVLAPDTSHPRTVTASGTAAPSPARRTPWWGALAVALAVLAAGAVWYWRTAALPAPPAEAQRWFDIGTTAVREGAYYSGLRALEEAVRIFPEYPQAYIRMAEAYHELDQAEEATNALLRVDARRLPTDDRLRQDGIRGLLLRQVDEATRAYRQLAERRAQDAGAWLDLGRAQEHAGLLTDARGSYERAIALDPTYAPAHLRLASVLTDGGDNEDLALKAFAEAERLYAASSYIEGEAEVLLRRAAILDARGDLAAARAALDKAQVLVRGNQHQSIRAQLLLSSVKASEGRFDEAAQLAGAALKAAEAANLDHVAALGLIELGFTVSQQPSPAPEYLERAIGYLDRAIALSAGRGARRTEARARLQQAALRLVQGRPRDALQAAEGTLGFLRDGHYRRFELTALSIMSRAHESLGDFATARRIAEDVVKVAEELKYDTQVAVALESLAELATIAGDLPQALAHRLRLVDTNRRMQDRAVLPYDLTNSSYLLIRLGRPAEAEPLLKEVEDGIAARIGAYVGRTRRVRVLRALGAVTARDFRGAAQAAELLGTKPASGADSTFRLAAAIVELAEAHLKRGRTGAPLSREAGEPGGPPDSAREVLVLQLLARLERREWQPALDGATAALRAPAWPVTPDVEWRLAAIGAAAATGLGDAGQEAALRGRARAALDRLRGEWKAHAGPYERRADLVELRRQAGLTQGGGG